MSANNQYVTSLTLSRVSLAENAQKQLNSYRIRFNEKKQHITRALSSNITFPKISSNNSHLAANSFVTSSLTLSFRCFSSSHSLALASECLEVCAAYPAANRVSTTELLSKHA
ncbi:hypothetical protein CW304_24680 [Bacillus sp. UFRGS-B20]|nr:hypothetical protein CW304_24680 [Bacillus sp. UFRGS-B20]